ncbi:MAG TPA: hypothetical protein VMU95_29540 [Trebonia sp.]|nr:hypothetical protein [Trebonia sp.]
MGDGGCPSSGTHQGACGPSITVASTNAAPPSAGATDVSQSHAPIATASSQASAASSSRSAISTAAGWLALARQSGSRACPKPPSGFR